MEKEFRILEINKDDFIRIVSSAVREGAELVMSMQRDSNPDFLTTRLIAHKTSLSESKIRALFEPYYIEFDGNKVVPYADYVKVVENYFKEAGKPVPNSIYGEFPVMTRTKREKQKRQRGLGRVIQDIVESRNPNLKIAQ